MADSLSTIGSIATFLASTYSDLPAGISGNLVIIVDSARQYVAQFTGANIGSNSISENYQAPIVTFAKADLQDFLLAGGQGTSTQLAELSTGQIEFGMSSKELRMLGENMLKALGRNYQFRQSLS